MRAKICGITRLEDALLAFQYGAWAVGFNFYERSPRYCAPSQAKEIIAKLPSTLVKVGIFVKPTSLLLLRYMEELSLDLAQIYLPPSDLPLSESARFILCLQPARLADLPSCTSLDKYGYLLIDAPHLHNTFGGTGKQACWKIAYHLAKDYPLILAGGLSPINVHQAIKAVRPFAVDVASGVERANGIKDHLLMKQFLMRTFNEQ